MSAPSSPASDRNQNTLQSSRLIVDYYSDVLCVWAWIAQRRMEELIEDFGDQIEVRYLYVDVFGNTEEKMAALWSAKGGYDGFGQHVLQSASGFDEAPVNINIWRKVQPSTSANAHLVLKAVCSVFGETESIRLALSIRRAFFIDTLNVGDLGVLYKLLEAQHLDINLVLESIRNGSAMAALMRDYQLAKAGNIKGSPCYVLDNGRQTLFGNIGYRVLRANVEELLKNPSGEASWC